MPLTSTIQTEPTSEPITLAEAKAHCRIDIADDDDLVDALITTAREYAETYTQRQLMSATWKLSLDCFPRCGPIRLPKSPVQEVISITYYDGNGALQTLAPSEYDVDSESEPARILPAFEKSWPTIRDKMNSIAIIYRAGYVKRSAIVAEALGQTTASASIAVATAYPLDSAAAGQLLLSIAQGTGIELTDDGLGGLVLNDDGGTGLTLVSGSVNYQTGAIAATFSAPLTTALAISASYLAIVPNVPKRIVQAMKMLIGAWYENREAVVTDNRIATDIVPMAVEALLDAADVSTLR